MAETLRYRDDQPVDHPAVTVDAFVDQSNAQAVRIEPGDDTRELLPHLQRLALVEVNFPAFGDGRGYSSARMLREAGYAKSHFSKWNIGARGNSSTAEATHADGRWFRFTPTPVKKNTLNLCRCHAFPNRWPPRSSAPRSSRHVRSYPLARAALP